MHIAQPLDPYSDMKNLGNHNKDSARFFIRSTNQYVALCTHDYLQDLGLSLFYSQQLLVNKITQTVDYKQVRLLYPGPLHRWHANLQILIA